MILWIASYPRSGNGLLRTVLKHCFGRGSCNKHGITIAEAAAQRPPGSPAATVEDLKGNLDLPAPWPEFYAQALASPELHLIKTHHPPEDGNPALYVLRDGRAAITSYWHFHRVLHPEAGRTMADLIAGRDYFGDWSSHWHSWQRRSKKARTLLLRYEELVQADEALLGRIAEFCGWSDAAKPWQNPFAEFQAARPELYRRGSKVWQPGEEWTPFCDSLFAWIHGPLMVQEGYWTADEMQAARSRFAIATEDAAFLTRLPADYARMAQTKII